MFHIYVCQQPGKPTHKTTSNGFEEAAYEFAERLARDKFGRWRGKVRNLSGEAPNATALVIDGAATFHAEIGHYTPYSQQWTPVQFTVTQQPNPPEPTTV